MHSSNTQLADRILWFDGDVSVEPDRVESMLQRIGSKKLFATRLSKDIKQFNRFATKSEKIVRKERNRPLNTEWNLPEQYKNLNVHQYIMDKMEHDLRGRNEDDMLKRISRVVLEYDRFEKHNLIDVLRTIIYIINTLDSNSIPWGIGRGSSVSSYVLYLIGAHDVDSVYYNLDITDFLKEE